MKLALVTMMDDGFLPGYEAFMTSFLTNNPWFCHDMIIIDLGLSEETKRIIRKYYDKIIFMPPKKGNYLQVNFDKTADSLKNTFYKLDAFSLYDYDRIVFIDMDTIVTGNIRLLFGAPGLSAVLGYDAGRDCMRGDYNSGVFVIGKEFLNEETYRGIINAAAPGFSMPDQKALNIFFKSRITCLPKKYNVEKRMLSTENYKRELAEALIIHYVALKPWQDHSMVSARENQYSELEKIWHYWYNKRGEINGKNKHTECGDS